MTEIKTVVEAGDIRGSTLKAAIPELLARDTPEFFVEYGIRIDDHAMVFHFYPPKSSPGRWVEVSRMAERLERAIPKHFDVAGGRVRATYAEELHSFCVIVRGLGAAPDPWPLVARFLDDVAESRPASS
jgi:hypothetical protein